MQTNVLKLSPDTMVTFINQKTGAKWPRWKKYGDLNKKEKGEFNLAGYPKNCILFDKDFKEATEEKIEEDYISFIEKLKGQGVKNYQSWRSPNGFHVLTAFKGLAELSDEVKTEIKRFYIEEFKCDPAKISDRGVVSMPDRPHFKNMITYPTKDNFFEAETPIKTGVLTQAIETVKKKQDAMKNIVANKDQDFSEFFEKDPLFLHCRDNIVPEGTLRNNILFPNLAIACAGTGKNKQEVDEIMKPIIENNFPGKVYAEFEGWLRKAYKGELNDFNKTIINTWFKDHTDAGEKYDVKPIDVTEELTVAASEDKKERIALIKHDEILNLATEEIDWLVKDWIAKGDICMVVGKSNSYKTTCLMHMGLAIAKGEMVFNKYDTKKSNVLYVNEENHAGVIRNIYSRVYNGLEIEKADGFFLAQEEALKLDVDKDTGVSDIRSLIDVIQENNIEVLILDTLRRFISFDENDATNMSKFYDRLKYLRKACGNITIIVLHHSKKSPSNGGYCDPRDEARGSSDIIQSADSAIAIARTVGKVSFKISHIKCRSAVEQSKKLIMVGSGDKVEDENSSPLCESESANDVESSATKTEITAEKIFEWVKKQNKNIFPRKDISEALKEFATSTMIFDALKLMEEDGNVSRQGKGPASVWVFPKKDIENKKEENKDGKNNTDNSLS